MTRFFGANPLTDNIGDWKMIDNSFNERIIERNEAFTAGFVLGVVISIVVGVLIWWLA